MGHTRWATAGLLAAAVVALTGCSAYGGNTQASPQAGPAPYSLVAGTAESNNAPAGTGDFVRRNGGAAPTGDEGRTAARWSAVKVGSAGALDPVVLNGAGLTLYRFDKDQPGARNQQDRSRKPAVSNCSGDCAKTWPKVLVGQGGRVFVDGIAKSDVGAIPVGDGTFQVTVGGWPVYRFAKDTAPGQTNGQGVGGTWFGMAPDGSKAGGGQGSTGAATGGAAPATQASAAGGAALTARSATLFDDPDRPGSGASQGVSNSGAADGCATVTRNKVVSSISASGTYKIWTGPDCTGRSMVLDGNADTLPPGFDNAVVSVRLAPGT